MPERRGPISIEEAVSTEVTEDDGDIGRPREGQIAGSRVGMRAHEYRGQQNCRRTDQSEVNLGIKVVSRSVKAGDDQCRRAQGVVVVRRSLRKLAPSASQSGKRDKQEEVRKSSNHSWRR